MFDLRSPDPGRYPWSCHLSLQHRISRRFLQVSGATSVEAKLREIVRQPTWSHLKGIDCARFWPNERDLSWASRGKFGSLTEGHEMDLFENLPFIYLMCQQNGFSALCVWILDLCPEINQNNISESVQRWFFFRVISHKCYCTWFSIQGEHPSLNDEWCCLPHKFDLFMSCVCNVFSQEPW